jgi:hypothetical protein
VAGHARAGESIEATLREAEEEIGLAVRLADLLRLGLRRRPDRRGRPGVADNELQEIFARVAPVDVAALTPSPAEVESIVALPFVDAGPVLRGDRDATGWRLVKGEGELRFEEERIRGADFVPSPDAYYDKVHESLSVVLSGGVPTAWEIG